MAVAAVLASSAAGVAAAGAATAPRFSAPVFTSADAYEMAVADLNGDGMPDVAAVGEYGAMSLLFGRGDGSLRTPVGLRVGAVKGIVVADIDAADLNGDGRPDLIVVSSDRSGSVAVLINDGGGRFHLDRRYASGNWVSAAVSADVNGDGLVDIVTAHSGSMDVSVLLGAGAGRFGAAQKFTGGGAGDVAVGELNGDGKPDLVLASYGKQMVAVRLGNGDGTFGSEYTFARRSRPRYDDAAPGGASEVALADLNQDGSLDLLLPQDQPYYTRRVSVFPGRGDGTFGAPSAYSMSGQPHVAVADFDSDGHADMATIGGGGLAVRNGRGDGTFGAVQVVPAGSGRPIVADFNRDGRADLASFGANRRGDLIGTDVLLNWTGLSAPPCVVAPVVRERLRLAKRQVKHAGCRVGHVGYRYSRTVRADRVISQRPWYGAVLPSDAPVNLVVSRGRRQ